MSPKTEFTPELRQRMAKNAKEGMKKGEALLKSANVAREEDMATVLGKVQAAARQTIGENFDVSVEPFGFTLRERPAIENADVTGTVKTTCSFDPWDGCHTTPDW
jgi:hypothetical protein